MPNDANDDNKSIRVLLLGDVYGDGGLKALFLKLNKIKDDERIDYIIANGENANNGFGISVSNMNYLFSLGIDVITSGNHIWNWTEIFDALDSEDRILRPANYGDEPNGHGFVLYKGIGVINLQGRVNLSYVENPFKWAERCVGQLSDKTKLIFVDFHAESTEEKEALGFFLDGKVTAVVGTHTHVQTADEKILPNGTAYITDLGLCGPSSSIIGCDTDMAIMRQKTQMPIKPVPSTNDSELDGVIIEADTVSGKALSIKRIRYF